MRADLYDVQWTQGRKLASVSNGKSIQYSYDHTGARVKKVVAGTTTEYRMAGSLIVTEKTGNDIIWYHYDSAGNLFVVNIGGTRYYYLRNIQNDVIGLIDENGNQVVEYKYDSWGNTVSITGTLAETVGKKNPFRYRGYYLDAETGMYYVSSRYYDPEIRRWISPDRVDVLTAKPRALTDKNLFAYCDNNPVVRIDHRGQFWDTVFDIISLGASVVEVCVNPTDPWAWAGLAGDAIDLIPFVTGVGEATRAVKAIDKVEDTIQVAKAVDFSADAADLVKTLDRSSGYTKSSLSIGRKIHKGYKASKEFDPFWKEYRTPIGIRPDYVDLRNKIIYELKPMNPRNARRGIRQLRRYNKALGGGYRMRLELY